MTWTYDYRDRPRPSYRIQDGSDDGDVAECWDEDVAKAIVAAMNSAPATGTSLTVSPSRSSEENRKPAPDPAKTLRERVYVPLSEIKLSPEARAELEAADIEWAARKAACVAPEPTKATERRGVYCLNASVWCPVYAIPFEGTELEARREVTRWISGERAAVAPWSFRYEARPLPETEET